MNKVRSFLNRDIKEFNVKLLVLSGILFIALMGFISYKLTNNSYALFTDTVTGTKTLTFHYEDPPTYTYRYGANGVNIGDPSSNVTGGTSNPSTLNKQFYLKHAIDNNTVAESYVCYTLNSTEYCLKGADTSAYSDNVSILQNSFGASNCNETNETDYSYYDCSSGSLSANAYSNGYVNANADDSHCYVNDLGNSSCGDDNK